MATFTMFHEFGRYLQDGTIDLDTHVFKLYLSNATPNQATHTVKADLAGITQQNGYAEVTLTASLAETGAGTGIWRFSNNADVLITATTGSFGPFRYILIYDDTPVAPADPLVGYWDIGIATTITPGNSLEIDLDISNSIFTLTVP